MRIEPKQAFYNEDTGAVQPWKDIEVTDAVGNALVAEGFATEIEGGGGGGDFSTAEVTTAGTPQIQLVICDDSEGQIGITSAFPGNATYTVPLYKGVSYAYLEEGSIDDYSVTGSIEIDDETFIITGDGTITCSHP